MLDKINKLSLPATILIASLILGGFFYASQISKQGSIERQQQIELKQKTELAKKDYIAERKNDCLNVYKTEGAKWNNVTGWRYDEDEDLCYITYKEQRPKTQAQCDMSLEASKKIYAPDPVPPYVFSTYLNCLSGTFENSF